MCVRDVWENLQLIFICTHTHTPTRRGREHAHRESAAADDDEPDRLQTPADGVFASVFAAQHLAYVVSLSGCCVASLVVFFGFVAFVVMSRLLTSQSSANDKTFTARMLLPLWFFVGLVRRHYGPRQTWTTLAQGQKGKHLPARAYPQRAAQPFNPSRFRGRNP